jgi:hypothetical protein
MAKWENMRLDTVEKRLAFRYKPPNSQEIKHPDGLATVYVSDASNGKPKFTALAYMGTAGRSSFYESYRTAEARDKRVADFFAGLTSWNERKAARKAERSKPHGLKVGDIIVNSWGYDQSNIDFYAVVKSSANYVWLHPVAQDGRETGFMCGYTWPSDPIRICPKKLEDGTDAEPVKHGASTCNGSDYVSMKYGSGHKWDGKPEHNSWYA